ncbi:hypothetical protein D3C86_880600 [compost metagenome]
MQRFLFDGDFSLAGSGCRFGLLALLFSLLCADGFNGAMSGKQIKQGAGVEGDSGFGYAAFLDIEQSRFLIGV